MILFSGAALQAQCSLGSQSGSSDAPTSEGATISLISDIWGGEYHTVNGIEVGATYRFETCGGASYDTQLTIYDLSNTSTFVDYNDDGCGLQSSVEFTAPTSGSYAVQLNQFNCATNSTSTEIFATLVSAAPDDGGGGVANDNCSDALPISCGQTVSGSTIGATVDNPGFCGTSVTAPGVWYTFTGTGSDVTLSTCDQASYDTKINVYSGSCSALSCVGGNDDGSGCTGFTSELTVSTTAGETYYVLVHGFLSATGSFDLTLSCAPVGPAAPANDLCSNAQSVSCGQTVSGSTVGANIDSPGAGFCGTGITSPGVWYTFTGDGSTVTASTCNQANYDTKINVYTGSCSSLSCVGGNDDSFGCSGNTSELSFATVSGQTYYVLVSGFGGNTGNFDLTLSCVSACDVAVTGTSSSPETCPGDSDGTISVSASCSSCSGLQYSVGSGFQSSSFFSGLAAGNYTVTVRDAGDFSCTASTVVNVGAGTGGDVLPPWSTYDVGSAGFLGNDFAQNPCDGNGTFTIDAGGNNGVTSTTDAVGFIGQTICGDGSITVKIESVSQYGQGGPMIRESAAAGARQVSIYSRLNNVLRWENRSSTNAPKTVQAHSRPFPFWLRLVRQGNWIFGYYSTTGTSFNYVHAAFVPMGTCVEFGMASFTFVPFAQGTTVFSNVSISGGNPSFEVPEGWNEGGIATAEAAVFPNPAQDVINVNFGAEVQQTTTMTLRNELGQVLRQRAVQPGAFQEEWNINDLASGLYLIELRSEGQPAKVLRFIKQ